MKHIINYCFNCFRIFNLAGKKHIRQVHTLKYKSRQTLCTQKLVLRMYWAVSVDKQFSQFSHNGRCCNIQNLNTNVYKQLENWNYWTVKLFQHCCSSKLKLWILRRRIVSEITELWYRSIPSVCSRIRRNGFSYKC